MAEGTLTFLSGNGWLVFSGGNSAGSPIRSQVLARAKGYGTTAYISLADDGGDALMDDMEDLGARTGYFVDLDYDAPETLDEQLQAATTIIIEVGSSLDALHEKLNGAALNAIKAAYERGAIVLIEGLAINLFGRWLISDDGAMLDGLDWVQNAFLEAESRGIEDSRAVQLVLSEHPEAIAINIAAGSALAMGVGGIEVWGEDKEVTISLGRGYVAD